MCTLRKKGREIGVQLFLGEDLCTTIYCTISCIDLLKRIVRSPDVPDSKKRCSRIISGGEMQYIYYTDLSGEPADPL